MSLGFGLGVEKFVSVPFNPASLFTDGAVGVLYDNNDLSTMFSDSAGTTAAVVNGPVGLQLDKSQGLGLGPEKIVNGDFSQGSTGWGVAGTDATHVITFSGGTARYQSDTTTPILQLSQTLPSPSATAMYVAEISISNYVSGSLKFDSDAGDRAVPASVGVHRIYFRRATGGFTLYRNSANVDITLDYVSVRQVLGNHRYQDSATSRPTLRGTPTGGNLVVNGDFATDTVWTKGTGWTIGSGVATKTAGTASGIDQSYVFTAGKVYRCTYTLTVSAGAFEFSFTGGTTTSGTVRTTSGTYTDYLTAQTGNNSIYLFGTSLFAGTVDNVQIFDVSTGSVIAPYGLQQDGTDDFMLTSSIDFSASDKMLVCVGVQKLSDVTTGIFCELSVNANSNAGTFWITAPLIAGAPDYNFYSRGSVVTVSGASASGAPAPITNVLTGIGSIAADSIILRVNGTQASASGSDQGTGNYGNYPLYFGRRGGASLPFNGLDFGGVIVNKTLTATQLTACEKWVASRTGVSF